MTKKRKSQRQSTRRQAKKLETACIQAAILNALSRDINQFLEEQRQQVALDLIDQTAASLNAETHSCTAVQLSDSDGGPARGALIYDLEKARKSLLGPAKP